MYTLVLKDSEKADKLKQSLPPGTFRLLCVGKSMDENQGGAMGALICMLTCRIVLALSMTDVPKKNKKGKRTA